MTFLPFPSLTTEASTFAPSTGGKQYKVSEGDVIKVEKLDAEVGAKVTFDNVLLVGGDTVKVGTPTVDGAKVEASVVSEGKGKKVIAYFILFSTCCDNCVHHGTSYYQISPALVILAFFNLAVRHTHI